MTDAPERIEPSCVEALRNYHQADEDGIMVLASRQAIDETIAAYWARVEECERLRADLAKPRVKPLAWEESPRAGWKRGRIAGLDASNRQAAFIFRIEYGWQYMGDVYLVSAHDGSIQSGLEAALDRAKVAAQADYERRILDALE